MRVFDGDEDGSAVIDMGAYEFLSTSSFSLGDNSSWRLSDNSFQIYPNPVSDKLFISHIDKLKSIEILNISGEIIEIQKVDDNLASINTSNLSYGLYFIRIKTGEAEVIKKIVKLK